MNLNTLLRGLLLDGAPLALEEAHLNRVKLILPALTEATSPYWRPIERAWDFVIRIKQLSQMRPFLEAVLSPVKRGSSHPAMELRHLPLVQPGDSVPS